jgi:hypothetical protein
MSSTLQKPYKDCAPSRIVLLEQEGPSRECSALTSMTGLKVRHCCFDTKDGLQRDKLYRSTGKRNAWRWYCCYQESDSQALKHKQRITNTKLEELYSD